MTTSTRRWVALGAVAPVAWLAATQPPPRTLALLAGLTLVTWGTARIAAARRAIAAPAAPPPSGDQPFTVRPPRRLDRRPARRSARDVRCPAGRIPQRHPARRRVDR
jgi:hypothetical protein